MRILIIGAGSIGLLFGAYLREAHHQVTFITKRAEQAKAIREHGISISNELNHTYSATALSTTDIPEEEEFQKIDLVMVSVKQHQLQEVLLWLKNNVMPKVPLIFLMNGLGHQEKIEEVLPQYSIYFAITNSGATRLSNHEVEERGKGVTIVGTLSTEQDSILTKDSIIFPFLQSLQKGKIAIKWTEKIELEMWRKCIINACINPLTALFQVHNGFLLENERAYEWMRILYDELSNFIKKHKPMAFSGALIKGDLLWNEVVDVCKLTFHNHSSMKQDIEKKSGTEIEAITGFFIKDAQKNGVHLIQHQTMYNSIKILENLAGKV